MSLSIDESILILKAEIIAQDWRLSAKRIARLEEVFACLRAQFEGRKIFLAILTMAASVLAYIKKSGDTFEPTALDFFKEAIARVVTIYEDHDSHPEQDEKVFKAVFSRFNLLKDKLKSGRL